MFPLRYRQAAIFVFMSFETDKWTWILFTNSRCQLFYKTGVLKNVANFTGKHMSQILFFRGEQDF